MFLNVKRLSIFEKLILETDLIQIGSGINGLVAKIKDYTNNKDQGSDKKIDITAQINQLLDYLFSLGEDGLNDKLDEPDFMKVFGDPAVKKALDLYFAYLETELKTFREELTAALNEPEINVQKVEKISQKMMMFTFPISDFDFDVAFLKCIQFLMIFLLNLIIHKKKDGKTIVSSTYAPDFFLCVTLRNFPPFFLP
jgi:hypothetical protein